MRSYHAARERTNSFPSRPRVTTVSDQPRIPVQEPDNPLTLGKPVTRKGSLAFFPESSSSSSGPLRQLRERLRRPSSAGATPSPRGFSGIMLVSGREGSSDTLVSHKLKAPRAKGSRSRPSSSSGAPDRNSRTETYIPRSSMTSVRKPTLKEPAPQREIPPNFSALRKSYVMQSLRIDGFTFSRRKSGANLTTRSTDPRRPKFRDTKHPLVISNPRLVEADDLPDGLRSSTADRKILHEYKHKMKARDTHFKLKNGKKHHPYSAKEVPYPVNYEKGNVDFGIWEDMWMRSCFKDLMWHSPDVAPKKVLELGCGSGSWILNSTRHWNDTHFVGLDIVPLHPDLHQLGSSQLAGRVTWVQANFLERLPFQDEEFDLIYARRIARGIPEDKWDPLLEEVYRVLKPGGTFELVDEELFFPGRPVHDCTEALLDLAVSPPLSFNGSMAESHSSSDSLSPPTPMSVNGNLHPAASTQGVSHAAQSLSSFSQLPVSQAVSNPQSFTLPRSKTLLHRTTTLSPNVVDNEQRFAPEKPEPLRPPANPRDHSLLELIFNEMHAARFINLEPLALLKNSLPLYFEATCIHPPVIITFPPPPAEPTPTDTPHPTDPLDTTLQKDNSTDHGSKKPSGMFLKTHSTPFLFIDDDRLDPLFGKPKLTSPGTSLGTIYEQFWQGESDSSVGDAAPPLISRERTIRDGHVTKCAERLTDITFDMHALNMMLALRVQEVVGCAEEMWAWVLSYQNTPHTSSSRDETQQQQHHHHQTLHNMVRADFDDLLLHFELDMQEHIGMGKLICTQLGWKESTKGRTQARKEFDRLCTEWSLYQQSLLRIPSSNGLSGGGSSSRSDATSFASPDSDAGSSGRRQSGTANGPPVSTLPPWKRISRKMCTAVAWKAHRNGGA
ncbi:hypothetical protein BC835DRAFT_1415601 [Cytidiella melzeri]|nr:hypothetical protein BC835DRAFT_1415601 [Cytidiella melzeri]